MWVSDSPDATSYVNVDRIPEADFLAGRARMRLPSGLTIAGLVTDELGQPVPGARVSQNFAFRHPDRSLLTTADGSFLFRNGRPGDLALTAQATHLAPVVTSMVLNASVGNLRITLPAGLALRGRVVDGAGAPVAGATLEAASPTSDSRTLFEWEAKTGADGRFVWSAAPTEQEYAVYAGGFEARERLKLAAGGPEHTIRLTKLSAPTPTRIHGRVVDAATRHLPPHFKPMGNKAPPIGIPKPAPPGDSANASIAPCLKGTAAFALTTFRPGITRSKCA
jgi:hypothetical protein